jgi:hypothetical protein
MRKISNELPFRIATDLGLDMVVVSSSGNDKTKYITKSDTTIVKVD